VTRDFLPSWPRPAAALVVAAVVNVGPAEAQMYRWADDSGGVHYTDGLNSVPDRFRSRATPLNMPSVPDSARSSSETPARAASGTTTIRFTPGERILVDARINGSVSARLLLDTGADRTLVSPRTLVAAGVSLVRPAATGQMVGVTGGTDVSVVRIGSLEVGEARVGAMLVISHHVNQSGIDGLLGRDFLEQFHVTIDSRSGLVTIAPK
jgi:predicted aspartyl protease